MEYSQAKIKADEVRAASIAAASVLNAFPKGVMGLTPDSVKASAEWKQAKTAFDRAFSAEQKMNAFMVKTFPAEMRNDRMSRRFAI